MDYSIGIHCKSNLSTSYDDGCFCAMHSSSSRLNIGSYFDSFLFNIYILLYENAITSIHGDKKYPTCLNSEQYNK